MDVSRNTAEFNLRLFWLTMLSIAVGFFAGYLLADSMSGLTTSAKAAVVVAAFGIDLEFRTLMCALHTCARKCEIQGILDCRGGRL